MNKKLIIVLIAILAFASVPALAALEYTTTILYFNVGSLSDIRVTLIQQSYVKATTSGNTTQNIEFNCGGMNCWWLNASVQGGATANQTYASSIIQVTNLGTTTPQVNISVNVTQSGCIDLHYFSNQTASDIYGAATPNSESQLGTANVTLDGAFNNTEHIGLWLWGNFSGCTTTADSKVELLRIFANS